MNAVTDKYEGLKAYLTGMGRTRPEALAFIAEFGDWPRLALQEIERRAMVVLAGLPDDEVVAIAGSEVNLRQLARQVQAEFGKEQ